MTEFDFDSLIQEAVSRLNQNEREQITDAARRIHAVLAQHEQHISQNLQTEAETVAAELRLKVTDLTGQTATLTATAAILSRTLHPVWGHCHATCIWGWRRCLGWLRGLHW